MGFEGGADSVPSLRGEPPRFAPCTADPAVKIERQFDHDAAGRLSAERHLGVNGADRALAYEYYPSGALRRKQMADGLWTGVPSRGWLELRLA